MSSNQEEKVSNFELDVDMLSSTVFMTLHLCSLHSISNRLSALPQEISDYTLICNKTISEPSQSNMETNYLLVSCGISKLQVESTHLIYRNWTFWRSPECRCTVWNNLIYSVIQLSSIENNHISRIQLYISLFAVVLLAVEELRTLTDGDGQNPTLCTWKTK